MNKTSVRALKKKKGILKCREQKIKRKAYCPGQLNVKGLSIT